MNNKKSPVRHIFYETELIVRESTTAKGVRDAEK
jgi:hypothetical protein